jgi:Concanavalin A-like lectin/glucanases superfamily
MSTQTAREREIREIAIAANCGEASDEQIARLDELIRSDRQLANYVARLLDQQASLAWQGLMTSGVSSAFEKEPQKHAQATPVRKRLSETRHWSWGWPTIAVGIGFILGGLAAATLYRLNSPGQPIARSESPSAAAAQYDARLVGSTACLWDGNSMGSHQIGSGLASGESLHLLEGLAEFKLNWAVSGRATVSLEGPVAMMLTSEGMPTLRFGRLTATISTAHRPFVLETPVGRLVLAEYGSIGVSAFGNEGEIHVFDGTAMLEPAWGTPDAESIPVKILAGQAIRVQPGDNGQPRIVHHPADADYFAAQVSMSSDGLAIPPEYVRAVKQTAPIGYWRLERDKWPQVPNAIGDRLACQVNGALGRPNYQGNQAVEFGVTDQDGEIVSTGTMDQVIGDSYSIEFWMKPSHYHVGAVISLVGDTPSASGLLPHGMLIELGGSNKIPTAIAHPGCIRYLHRSPAGNETQTGTSCYSKTPYTLRKWQHVVATKEGPHMRLYVNGVQVAAGEDASDLPAGLRLLVGRLYPARGVRPFIGQLDELALYRRALTSREVAEHYRLVRPVVANRSSS